MQLPAVILTALGSGVYGKTLPDGEFEPMLNPATKNPVRYLDILDGDEGAILRMSVMEGAGDDEIQSGDRIEAVLDVRQRDKVRAVAGQGGELDHRAYTDLQARVRKYRLSARPVYETAKARAAA